MVRVWTKLGQITPYEITVIPVELYHELIGTKPKPVVKIGLEFMELDAAISRDFGFRWPEAVSFAGQAVLHGSKNTTGLNYSVSASSTKGVLQFLKREGWARLLANPDLYVRMGEEAIFHSGGEFPVSTSIGQYGQHHRKVEWKPYGLTVKVLPRSADGLNIHSAIEVEISEVNHSLASEGIPAITKRNLKTKMNSIDGQTVILSGLVRQMASKEEEGVPLLSDIPILGGLFFKKKSKIKEETELVMAITFSLANRAREKEALEGFQRRFDDFLK